MIEYFQEYKEIYLGIVFLVLGQSIIPAISLYNRSTAMKRFVKWCLDDDNLHEFNLNHWLMLFLAGVSWYKRFLPIGKHDFDLCLSNVNTSIIKKKEIKDRLDNTQYILNKTYNVISRPKLKISKQDWAQSMTNLLKDIIKKKDADWQTPKDMYRIIRKLVLLKIYPFIPLLISLVLLVFYIGCTFVIKETLIIPSAPRTIKETAKVRSQSILKNPNFLAGTSYWSITQEYGKNRTKANWSTKNNYLILNTPHESSVTIAQGKIELAEVQHHDYYISFSVVPESGGTEALIKVLFEDPVNAFTIKQKFTPSKSDSIYMIDLPSFGGFFDFKLTQIGSEGSDSEDIQCRYSYVRLVAKLKPRIIACQIQADEPGNNYLLDYSLMEGDPKYVQSDVDYYQVFRYLPEGNLYILYNQFQVSRLSSETYINVKMPGMYRIDATLGGITYDSIDSILVNDSIGVDLTFNRSIPKGVIHLKILKDENSILSDSMKVQITSQDDIHYFRGGDGILKDNYFHYIDHNGYLQKNFWVLSVTQPNEYYIVDFFMNDSLIHREVNVRPIFSRFWETQKITINLD